jgi:hypothetical protein
MPASGMEANGFLTDPNNYTLSREDKQFLKNETF